MSSAAHEIEYRELGIEVPVGQVGSRLAELWTSNQVATKSSLINLVVYSEKEGSLCPNTDILKEVAREHACRALVIEANRSTVSDPSVRAWITAHCSTGTAGAKQMCSEQVAFLVNGEPSRIVPNIVFAHLDSDLPLVLWWQGSFSSAFVSHLSTRVDRLIVDSAKWDDPKQEFVRLQEARRVSGSRFVTLDLVATRLFAFRLALAACFDSPETLSALDRCDEISIAHNPDQLITGLTFAAWIAIKTDWILEGSAKSLSLRRQTGSTIAVRLTPENETFSEAGLHSVKMKGNEFSATVVPAANGRYLQSHATAKQSTIECLTPIDVRSRGSLVSERLQLPGNDALFLRIWEQLLRVL